MSHLEGICVVITKYGDSVCEPDESYRKPLFCKYQALHYNIRCLPVQSYKRHLFCKYQVCCQSLSLHLMSPTEGICVVSTTYGDCVCVCVCVCV